MKTAKEINARRERFLTDWYDDLCEALEDLRADIEEWQRIFDDGLMSGNEHEMSRARLGAAMDVAEMQVLQENIEYVTARLESLETA